MEPINCWFLRKKNLEVGKEDSGILAFQGAFLSSNFAPTHQKKGELLAKNGTALYIDENGFVADTDSSNVFFVRKDTVSTAVESDMVWETALGAEAAGLVESVNLKLKHENLSKAELKEDLASKAITEVFGINIYNEVVSYSGIEVDGQTHLFTGSETTNKLKKAVRGNLMDPSNSSTMIKI